MATAPTTTTRLPNRVEQSITMGDRIGRVGSWDLMAQIGEGELCQVFLACQAAAGNSEPPRNAREPAYAVKVLRPRWETCVPAIEIMRREAMVGIAVGQANVVPVLQASLSEPPFFVVMPRLSGQSLAVALELGWRPELPVCLWIARQVATGLAAIESARGMIHGDVTPGNIVVSPNGHVTLIDLGFARTKDECRAAIDRPVLGTLRYAAPESLTSAYATDVRSDLYSLGVTLYEMLTGVPPFDADAPADLVRLHREVKPTCIRERRPDVPKPIASLVHAMLSKNPLHRPQTLREAIDLLVRLEVEWFADRAA